MGIVKPEYHLKSEWDLPSFRKRMQGPASGRRLEAELNLTPLIDVFSVIILFLIGTFSATGDIIMVTQGINLPVAKNSYLLQRHPVVTVTQEGVILEGAVTDQNADIEDRVEDRDWELPQMKAKLRSYREFFESVEPGVPFPGRIVIQADKGITFLYLKRVMYTLVAEGYNSIDLVVRGEGRQMRTAPGADL